MSAGFSAEAAAFTRSVTPVPMSAQTMGIETVWISPGWEGGAPSRMLLVGKVPKSTISAALLLMTQPGWISVARTSTVTSAASAKKSAPQRARPMLAAMLLFIMPASLIGESDANESRRGTGRHLPGPDIPKTEGEVERATIGATQAQLILVDAMVAAIIGP
ncbi:hypothetical protein D3C79_817790 [compost metagenome]